MSDVFDGSKIKVSDCPADFVPAGTEVVVGIDYSKDGDCAVNGFYDLKTGEYHIQEVLHNAALSGWPGKDETETQK